VHERIVAEIRANPLAMLELPRAMTPAEMVGGFGVPGGPGLPGRLEDSFDPVGAPAFAERARSLNTLAPLPGSRGSSFERDMGRAPGPEL
jgi:hypothetical protein